MPGPAAVSRRILLACAAGAPFIALVGACSSGDSESATPTAQEPVQASDPVSDAISDEWLLVARYEATFARHPELEADLGAFRDQHVAHAQALGSQRPAELADLGEAPKSVGRAIALLAAAEQTASGLRVESCVRCQDSSSARLLALIAASESAHATALEGRAS